MRKSLFSFLFFLFCWSVSAQRLHTPSEVQQYMKKSPISFSLDTLLEEPSIKELLLVEEGYFLVITEMGYQLEKRAFTLSPTAKKYLKKAEKFERKNKKAKAIKFLKKAHALHPENMRVMKYLGSLYLENNQADRSISLLEKVVEINEIDFEAHSLLAASYHKFGTREKALEHISMAHLLNRNHPKIIEMLKVIYLDNKLEYHDHVFDPQYKIEMKGDSISIQANEAPWKAFASCKSLWLHEAQYKKEMRNFAKIDLERVEEKECLLNALLSYEEMENGKDAYPLLGYLGTALENEMVNDFILYEIETRQDPTMVSLMPKEKMERLMKYLMTVRVGKEVGVR